MARGLSGHKGNRHEDAYCNGRGAFRWAHCRMRRSSARDRLHCRSNRAGVLVRRWGPVHDRRAAERRVCAWRCRIWRSVHWTGWVLRFRRHVPADLRRVAVLRLVGDSVVWVRLRGASERLDVHRRERKRRLSRWCVRAAAHWGEPQLITQAIRLQGTTRRRSIGTRRPSLRLPQT